MNKCLPLLLSIIWFVACQPTHNLGTPFQEGQEVTLTAAMGEQSSHRMPNTQRVSGKDATDNIDLTWDEGDNILVKVGDKSSIFTLTDGVGTQQGTFIGTMPADGASYNVQYPTMTPNLSEQHYVPDGFGKELMLMTTKTEGTLDGGFTLSADYALLGLQLTGNTAIGKIVLSKNNANGTAGDLSYTLLCPNVTLSAVPTLFYIVVLPDTWAHGFTVDVYNKDHSTIIKQFVTTKSTTFSTTTATVMPEKSVKKTYDHVDLGLPSGTLWAKCNIGADTETDAGLYFQWGDTRGYTADQVGADKIFDWAHYKFGTRDNLTKYNSTDGLTTLQPEDDASYANMGEDWRVPTEEQYRELKDHTTSEWVDNYNNTGVSGRLFSAKNGNTLFLPAVGAASSNVVYGISLYGLYWSANCEENAGINFGFSNDNKIYINNNPSSSGYPIRGVKEANK